MAATLLVTAHLDGRHVSVARDTMGLGDEAPHRAGLHPWPLRGPAPGSAGTFPAHTIVLVASHDEALAVSTALERHWPPPPAVLGEYTVIVVGEAEEPPQGRQQGDAPGIIYTVNELSTHYRSPAVEVLDLR